MAVPPVASSFWTHFFASRHLLRSGIEQRAAIFIYRGGEVNHGEAILGAEVFQAVFHRLAGLLHLDAAHAARRIQHQHHVARHVVFLGQLHFGREQHREIAVFRGDRPVRQDGEAHILFAGGIIELEVLVERRLILVEVDDHFLVVGAFQGDGMGGTVDVGDAVLRLDRRRDGEILQGGRRFAIRFERVNVLDQTVFVGGDAVKAQSDFLIAVGRNRKDLESGQVVAEILQQGGVLSSPDDAGVDLAPLGGLDDFALAFPCRPPTW